MPINQEQFEALPEEARELYQPVEGKEGEYAFVKPAAPEPGPGHESALQKERDAAAAAKKEAKDLFNALKAKEAEIETAKKERLKAEGREIELRDAEIQAKQAEIEALTARVGEMEQLGKTLSEQLTRATGHDRARAKVTSMPAFNPAASYALDLVIEKEVGSTTLDDGRIVPAILDPKTGKIALDPKTGKEMIGEEWLDPWAAGLQTRGVPIFKPDAPSELSGGPTHRGIGKGLADMSPTERSQALAALQAEKGETAGLQEYSRRYQAEMKAKQQKPPQSVRH